MNWANLYDVLSWLMTAGAGVVSWGILDICERRNWRARWLKRLGAWIASLDYEAKRWLAIGVAAVLTLLAWGVSMLFFYVAVPGSWRAGVEEAVRQLLVSLPLAFTFSQVAHARAKSVRTIRLEPRG